MKEATWFAAIAAVVAGWLWLAFGAGVAVDRFGPTVFNVHRGAMAEQLCMLGYALMIVASIMTATEQLMGKLTQSTARRDNDAAVAAPTSEPTGDIDLSNLPTGKTMAQKRQDAMNYLQRD